MDMIGWTLVPLGIFKAQMKLKVILYGNRHFLPHGTMQYSNDLWTVQ
jgi:hypothetical protein